MDKPVDTQKVFDTDRVTNPEARAFLEQFKIHGGITREFYQRVPEDKFDYQMTPISDSPRKTLAHMITNQRNHLKAFDEGELRYGDEYDDLKDYQRLPKDQLLAILQKEDERLVDFLTNSANLAKKVKVPQGENGELIEIPVINVLWSLNSHEIRHGGTNQSIEDHLGMSRSELVKNTWG